MPLVNQSIPNLINGVSQQPAALRLPSQCDLQENAFSSIVEGLKKRPPLRHVTKLSGTVLDSAFIHLINRDSVERYVVVVTDEDIDVYDLQGNAKTVSFPDGTDYIDTATPGDDITAITIADYTFIVNKAKTVAMDAALSSVNDNVALVYVKAAQASTDYKVTIESTTYTYTSDTTPTTSEIAAGLATAIGTGPGGNYTVTRQNYVLAIERNSSTAFALTTEDGAGGNSMKSTKGKVQRFTDLPTVAPNGYIVEVVGEAESQSDNYYVVFETHDGGAMGEGVWSETVKPGITYQLDPATMPHALIRQADGTFTFEQIDWGARTAGDEDTAPDPTFVGEEINDLFLFKNRLGFLTNENVVMSRSGKFFEFFRETATAILDTDPIDVAVSHNKVSILRHAIPYSEQLILFSDQTQFQLQGGDLLTPKTVSITPTTEFESWHGAKPVGAGSNIYFSANVGEYSMVREYFVSNQNNTKDAAEITAHVPQYVPKNISKFAAASNADLLIAFSPEELNELYAYKYHWRGDQKLQSSWSKWVFNDECEILDIGFIDNYLYMVTQYSDGVYLERIDISPQQTDSGSSYLTHLDRRITEDECTSVTYNSGTNRTTFTLPYEIPEDAEMVVVTRNNGGSPPEGDVYAVVSQGTSTVLVNGDKTGVNVFIGMKYTMRYRFSHQFIKKDSGNGALVALDNGRLQMKTWRARYENTGRFNAEVTPKYRDTSTYKFTGRLLGSGNNQIGTVAIEDGVFVFPILSKNDQVTVDLVNDSHLPCFFLSVDWEAEYSAKSRRI